MLERLGEIVNGDEALVRRGRYFCETFMLEVGETQYLIEVRQGRIESVETGPFVGENSGRSCHNPAITISSRCCATAASCSTANCSR